MRDCPLKIKVTAHPNGMSSDGYACSATGGHCIPCKDCDSRRAREAPPAELGKISADNPKCPHCGETMSAFWDAMRFDKVTGEYSAISETVYGCKLCLAKVAENTQTPKGI